MKTGHILKAALLATTLGFTPLAASAAEEGDSAPDTALDSLRAALIDDSDLYADLRYRYETVDQNNALQDAHASTARVKAGYKTGSWYDFSALVEIESSVNIGAEDYNDTVNLKGTHSVVADPDHTELNQLWLAYAGLPQTKITGGRQGMNLDNQRFIGTVGWRQLDQTYDAVAVTNNSLEKLSLLYSYVWNVNRINGDDHPLGDLSTNTHVVHASYAHADWLNVTAYGYLLDIHDAPGLSSDTYGLRLTGKYPVNDDWSLSYTLEGAEQSDYENNPASYDATYIYAAPAAHWKGFTFEAGFESLEGDGANAFQTPLATLHAHNGWADQFLGATPVNGLEDTYGKIVYKVSGVHEWVDGTKLMAVYHDFDSERGGMDYGDELNLLAAKTFKGKGPVKSWSLALKYADYDADTFSVDTEKFWFVLGAKF